MLPPQPRHRPGDVTDSPVLGLASGFPDDIAWIRSYVIKEEGGTLGTTCIYQATDVDKVREHAKRVDMPADEVLEIADIVIVRPDPQPQAA